MWMKFEQGDKGLPIARTRSGKICLPPRDAQIVIGEWYEVEIEEEKERFCRLKIIRCFRDVESMTIHVPQFFPTRFEDEHGEEISYPRVYTVSEELYSGEVWRVRVDHEKRSFVPVEWLNGQPYWHSEAIANKLNGLRQADDLFIFKTNRHFPTKVFIKKNSRLDDRHVGESIDTTTFTLDECEAFYASHRIEWNANTNKIINGSDGVYPSFDPYGLH